MVRHLKNTSDNTSLFLSICFPKMSVSSINLNFCGIPVSSLWKMRKNETLHAQNLPTKEFPPCDAAAVGFSGIFFCSNPKGLKKKNYAGQRFRPFACSVLGLPNKMAC